MYKEFWDEWMAVPIPADFNPEEAKEYVKQVNEEPHAPEAPGEGALLPREEHRDGAECEPRPPGAASRRSMWRRSGRCWPASSGASSSLPETRRRAVRPLPPPARSRCLPIRLPPAPRTCIFRPGSTCDVSDRARNRLTIREVTSISLLSICVGVGSCTEILCRFAGVAHLVEQLTCNQQVIGFESHRQLSETIRRPKTDEVDITEGFPSGQREQTVNLPALCLRRFESFPLHQSGREQPRGCSSVGRAPAFQAGCRGFESRRPLQRSSYRDSS